MNLLRYLLDNEKAVMSSSNVLDGERRLRDDGSSDVKLQMGEYYSYEDIVRWLKSLERQHPEIVRVTSVGITPEERTIYGVKVYFILKKLCGNLATDDPTTFGYIADVHLYILPTFNVSFWTPTVKP